jgi:hypothetical protein
MKFIISLFVITFLTGCGTKNLMPDINMAMLTVENQNEFLQSKHIKAFNDSADKNTFSLNIPLETFNRRVTNSYCMSSEYWSASYKHGGAGLQKAINNYYSVMKFENAAYVLSDHKMYGQKIELGYVAEAEGNNKTKLTLFTKYHCCGKKGNALFSPQFDVTFLAWARGEKIMNIHWLECQPPR